MKWANTEEEAPRSAFLNLADLPIEGAIEASTTENLDPLQSHGFVGMTASPSKARLQLGVDEDLGIGGGMLVQRCMPVD